MKRRNKTPNRQGAKSAKKPKNSVLLASLAPWRFVFGGALILLACHCTDERLSPVENSPGGPAAPLHMFSRDLHEDMNAQAMAALERDAFRREHRFLDAAEPGYLFRTTRASEDDIAAGRWSKDDVFQIGAQLFHVIFTKEAGYGAQDLPLVGRFHKGRRGGPDASRCASCHWRGGPAGAGDGADNAYLDGDGDRESSALARNPIALPGAGLVEILAGEMNAELEGERRALIAMAKKTGINATGALTAKGISFGKLTARPDGSVDTSKVEGIDGDLVLKPFGWKGNIASIRDAVEDALLVHHGMESDHLVTTAPKERIGSFAAPDPDGDGIPNEIREGQITALTLFVAMQEVPVQTTPVTSEMVLMWAKGRTRFDEIGCSSCHVSSLPLSTPTFSLSSRTGGATISVDLATDGAEPRIVPDVQTGEHRVFLFSDFKRHDLGPALAEPRADRGVAPNLFLTRPLWGVARSRPYLHDARAQTLEDAILLHGGEAQAARDAYAALSDAERGTIRVFLTSLTRARRLVTQ